MPVDRDVVLAKLSALEHCLARVRHVTAGAAGALDDVTVQEVVTLNLQRAAQCAIDLAHHGVAGFGLGTATSLGDAFERLAAVGHISHELVPKMRAMVGFRNVAVHAYEDIDPDVLRSIVAKHLPDLEQLGAAAARWVDAVA